MRFPSARSRASIAGSLRLNSNGFLRVASYKLTTKTHRRGGLSGVRPPTSRLGTGFSLFAMGMYSHVHYFAPAPFRSCTGSAPCKNRHSTPIAPAPPAPRGRWNQLRQPRRRPPLFGRPEPRERFRRLEPAASSSVPRQTATTASSSEGRRGPPSAWNTSPQTPREGKSRLALPGARAHEALTFSYTNHVACTGTWGTTAVSPETASDLLDRPAVGARSYCRPEQRLFVSIAGI